MITRSHSLKAITSIALVAMACVGLVNCGGGGGGSGPTGSGSGDQIMIQPRPPASVGPDLAVGLPSVSNSAPTVGTQFTLSAIVRNDGDTPSAATTLRYYQSTDATITTSDTAVGTGAVAELAASATSSGSVDLTAPSTAGAYYYGACVDAVTDESDTTNNCSASVQVDVSEPQQGQGGPQTPQGPDLAAVAFFLASGVHDGAPGRSLTFQARIRNVGNVVSPATTLRFYSSRNRTISTDDTLLGTVAVETIIPSRRIDSKTLTLTAPSTPGTYYYGACVDAVTDESDTTNNCSDARPITVDGPPPDLVVTGPNVGEIQADGTFWFIATVGNQGAGGAAATTVRYKRSTDGTITTSDTTVGTDEAPTLIPSAGYGATIQLTAPSTPGTYYYGVCVDPVPSESDTSNNCSASVRVEVGGPPPDLVVLAPSVSAINETPPLDGTFSLVVTVRNQGGGTAAATTVRYYRSTDGTITTSDTQLHTGPVNRLSPSGTSEATILLTAEDAPGTYYYGACVDEVPRESDTTNNCSASVQVTVSGTPPPEQGNPDLTFQVAGVGSGPSEEGIFVRFTIIVLNVGDRASAASTLRYLRSTDATITTSDAQVGTDTVPGLPASEFSRYTREVLPSSPGTYYYGVCVDPVAGESDTTNNCSAGLQVVVPARSALQGEATPDLTIGGLVIFYSPGPFGIATLGLTTDVRNNGDGDAAATTLRYYRSTDATITTSDTQEDTAAALAAGETSSKQVDLTPQSTPGMYYYGACVDAVAGESDTTNNCSPSVLVTVRESDTIN